MNPLERVLDGRPPWLAIDHTSSLCPVPPPMRHCDELCCGAALLLSRNECPRDRLTGLGSTAGRASSSRKRASRPKLARPHRHRLLVLRDIAEEDRARRKRAVLH